MMTLFECGGSWHDVAVVCRNSLSPALFLVMVIPSRIEAMQEFSFRAFEVFCAFACARMSVAANYQKLFYKLTENGDARFMRVL